MFNNIQFYYGFQDEYELIKNNLTDNCFYYTYEKIYFKDNPTIAIYYKDYQSLIKDKDIVEIEKILSNIALVVNDRLYLNNTLIYSYNLENISSSLESLLQNKFNKYLLKNSEEEQIINSPIKINKSLMAQNLKITGDTDIDGTVSAKNLLYSDNALTIPCSLIINGDNAILTVNKNLIVNGVADLATVNIKDGEAILNKLAFSNNAEIINLPPYETDNYKYDFKQGILNVNEIHANIVTVGGEQVSTVNKNTVQFDNIQIGNIVLSEENGNLKITSVSLKE